MKVLSFSLLLLFGAVSNIFGSAEKDTLLTIMKQELAADMQELQQQDIKPYFMSFRAEDDYEVGIYTSYGTLLGSQENHVRTFVPQLRLGSPQLDNFKYETQGSDNGSYSTIPTNCASRDAIRQNIWDQTLRRYKTARERLIQATSQTETQVDNEDSTACFAPAPVENYYEEPLTNYKLPASVIREWEGRLTRVSAVFQQWKDFTDTQVIFNYQVQRRWLINSEGTSVVQNNRTVRIMLLAQLKAEDGMDLPLYEDFMCYDVDSLPSEETLIATAQQIGERLVALSKAPVAEPYSGPAIMSGPASGVFFHEIFGHRLEAHRMKSGGQTFKKMVGERVLPKTFNVYCDPTIDHYKGNPVWGFYRYDDEGVKARRVHNVENGVLRDFLVSRVPIDGFLQSNGHGRTSNGMDPVSRQSNLIVETSAPYTEAQLRQMLRDEARRQGKAYGYYFKSVTGGYTYTGEGGSLNSFNVMPLEVLRIYVDGRPDELVRGVDMIGTPLSMFSNVVAGGDTPSTFVGVCGAESGIVPVTASSPMIYVSKIETQRRPKAIEQPTILKAPVFTNKGSNLSGGSPSEISQSEEDALIFSALEDEMHRCQDSLRMADHEAPFYYNYTMSHSMPFSYGAELGEITNEAPNTWFYMLNVDTKLGDYQHTSDMSISPSGFGTGSEHPSYDLVRRGLWQLTDNDYKGSLRAMATKQNRLSQMPLSPAEAALADMESLPAVTYIGQRTSPVSIPKDELRDLSRSLSTIFSQYPTLHSSLVRISGAIQDTYRLTSEGQRIKVPNDWIEIEAEVSARTNIGVSISDRFNLPYLSAEELIADSANLRQHIRQLADLMVARTQAPVNTDEYYAGPVLVEGSRVSSDFYNSFVMPTICAGRDFMSSNSLNASKLGRRIMDSRLSLYQLTDSVWKGKRLFGYYPTDAYGVKPQALTLVENGLFRQMINGRYPALKAEHTTGNMRLNENSSDCVCPGVLHLSATKTQPKKKLYQELLKLAKSEGYEYAYIIRCIPGMGDSDLYRVDVNTGKETLCFASEIGISASDWRQVLGISSEEQIINSRQIGGIPVTFITPEAILFDGIEVQATSPTTEVQPALTYPLLRDAQNAGK